MGRIIRRTITITITESWTIVWTDEGRADDKPQTQATSSVQGQPKPQEEGDETILPAVTPGTAASVQPPDMSPNQAQAVNLNAPTVAVIQKINEVRETNISPKGKSLCLRELIRQRYEPSVCG